MAERRLTRRECERLLAGMQLAARPGPGWAQRWDAWQRQYGQREACLHLGRRHKWVEFPLGEFTNPAISAPACAGAGP
jgi:hypothetical protein